MKNIILYISIFFFLSQLTAQDLTLHSAANGIFIQIPGSEYAWQSFEVKKLRRGKMKQIGYLNPPNTIAELRQRYLEVKDLFPGQLRNEEESLAMIWEFAEQKKPLEKLSLFRMPSVQIALGLAWLDQEAEQGQTCQYQLSGGANVFTGIIQHAPDQFGHSPIIPLSSSRAEEFPTAEWWTKLNMNLADYQVYRKSLEEREFQEIYPLRQKAQGGDSLRLIMTDTTVREEGIFEYYVIPVDILGNRGRPSPRLKAGNFSTRSIPVIYNFQVKSQSETKQLRLSWSLHNSQRVRSLQVFRSRNPHRGFELISEVTSKDSSFLDPVDDPGEGYYYYLKINDMAGEDLRSVTTFGIYKGEHPAEKPVRLTALNHERGIQLYWQGRGDNIRGYYVYRAQGYQGELVQISDFIPVDSIAQSSFLDTVSLNSSSVYSYAVKAESKSYVLSEFSERVSIRPSKPTFISPPLSINGQFQNQQIRIMWEDLASREAKLDGYLVFRREKGKREYEEVSAEKIPFRQNYYYDLDFEPGKTYEYAVKAIDIFGAESNLSRSTEIALPLPYLPERLGLERNARGILLQWNHQQTNFPYRVQILKTDESGRDQVLGQYAPEKNNILDQGVKKGEIYVYRLVCVNQAGEKLTSSDPVSIRY